MDLIFWLFMSMDLKDPSSNTVFLTSMMVLARHSHGQKYTERGKKKGVGGGGIDQCIYVYSGSCSLLYQDVVLIGCVACSIVVACTSFIGKETGMFTIGVKRPEVVKAC